MAERIFRGFFIFEPPDFFADFVAGFFLLIFEGKSAQKNPPGKSPAKSSKTYTTKIPDNFLQRGMANIFLTEDLRLPPTLEKIAWSSNTEKSKVSETGFYSPPLLERKVATNTLTPL